MTSYIQLISKIQAFCDAHLQIERFDAEFGEQRPNLATESEKYPYVFLEPTSGIPNYDLNEITVTITCYDIIQKGRENINTIVSDCHLILTDLYSYYNQGKDGELIALSASQTPLNNFDLDYVAGWSMDITFELEGYCTDAIPIDPITPPIDPSCDPATYTVENSEGTELDSGEIESGSSKTITISDIDVTVNGTDEGDLVSAKDVAIVLEDMVGDPVTPNSIDVTNNTVTLEVDMGTASLGAKPQKTDQQISYALEDDGATQRGRETDYFTLPENNPFGNTNKFTALDGSQTYTDGIILDWSTYKDGEVLAIVNDLNGTGNVTWSTALTEIAALTIDGKDWYMPNINELFNFAKYGGAELRLLSYSPFLISSSENSRAWSSTTPGNTTTRACYMSMQKSVGVGDAGKTNSYRWMAVRYYTDAELGI